MTRKEEEIVYAVRIDLERQPKTPLFSRYRFIIVNSNNISSRSSQVFMATKQLINNVFFHS